MQVTLLLRRFGKGQGAWRGAGGAPRQAATASCRTRANGDRRLETGAVAAELCPKQAALRTREKRATQPRGPQTLLQSMQLRAARGASPGERPMAPLRGAACQLARGSEGDARRLPAGLASPSRRREEAQESKRPIGAVVVPPDSGGFRVAPPEGAGAPARRPPATAPPAAGPLGAPEPTGPSGPADEVTELAVRLRGAGLSAEADRKAQRDLARLATLPMSAPEFHVISGYLDVLASLPWRCYARPHRCLAAARQCLDAHHAGLEECKQRVIEHVAMSRLQSRPSGTVLLLVSPPGTGKTSLAAAVADAMGRPLCRIALGGVSDPAELRGHRRTYVGAMPGRIIEAVQAAGCRDPVVLLDEIDKTGAPGAGRSLGRGSSAVCAALLELLDPEQAASFKDAFLALPFDLSQCTFIATANDTASIPLPLLDRCEVVRLPPYSLADKARIAREKLLPKLLREHALPEGAVVLEAHAAASLVRGWTREAGVRGLRRLLSRACRYQVMRLAEAEDARRGLSEASSSAGRIRPAAPTSAAPGPDTAGASLLLASEADLTGVFGAPPFPAPATRQQRLPAGVANGLAWSSFGGSTLLIEALVLPHEQLPSHPARSPAAARVGTVIVSGSAGPVLREAVHAATSWLRANWGEVAGLFGNPLASPPLAGHDLHVHLPRAAVPKDGPSAGVPTVAAIASALTGVPLRQGVAASGEVSLRGMLLAVGGIREKLAAAKAAGISAVVIPAGNRGDIDGLPADERSGIRVVPAATLIEALKALTQRPPQPVAAQGSRSDDSSSAPTAPPPQQWTRASRL